MKLSQIRIHILALFILLAASSMNGQKALDMNLIIMIDDELLLTYIKPIIVGHSLNGSKSDTLETTYIPGDLILHQPLNADDKSLISRLEFSLQENGEIFNYSIPIGNSWFESTYMVLRIYNLDKRKYRRKYTPLYEGGNYTFELDYPGGSMLRVGKRAIPRPE